MDNPGNLLLSWILSACVIMAAAYLVPGVRVANFTNALIVSIVLGVVNALIRPILLLLTLPVTLLTFGLFALIINALLVLLTARLVPGFEVQDLGSALLFSIILSVINWVVFSLLL